MSIRYRRFGSNENEIAAIIFARGLNDLLLRARYPAYVDVDDPVAWKTAYERDRSAVFEHLGGSDSESWFAEDGNAVLGYARSIRRDGVRQLTDFWVLPGNQAGGIGRSLLERTFGPEPDGRGRIVVATTHGAALARYLKAGLDVVAPVLEFERPSRTTPAPATLRATLVPEPIADDEATRAILNRIDRAVLGFEREADHRFFIANRTGHLYRRAGEPVGYGYVGRWQGPFAALEPESLPPILVHANEVADRIGAGGALNVPLTNVAATRFLLSRGYRMHDRFVMLFLSDGPRPALDRYIFWSPGFC